MKTWSPWMDQLTLTHTRAKSVQSSLRGLHLYLPGSRINATTAASLSPPTRCSLTRKGENLQSRKRLGHSYHFSSGCFFLFVCFPQTLSWLPKKHLCPSQAIFQQLPTIIAYCIHFGSTEEMKATKQHCPVEIQLPASSASGLSCPVAILGNRFDWRRG